MSNSQRIPHQPFLVVLSAPSGAGKTSICKAVLRRDHGLAYSVSVTTRARRKGERNGHSYYYVSPAEFQRLVERGELLEHAQVYDTWYGTPKKPLLRYFRNGKDVIADLDVQGMRSCRRELPGTVSIFIMAPSRTELQRRLRSRGSESAAAMLRRQAELDRELAAIPEFDYLVVNRKFSKAVEDVLAIIRSERLRTSRRLPLVEKKEKGGIL
ncbi:MAG: guanylate kinase [candidate division WOR-3 bacterium]